MAGDGEEWDTYQHDTRLACKYGKKCYRKSLDHLDKFKHPPKRKQDDDSNQREDEQNPHKKQKVNSNKTSAPNTNQNSSDTEDCVGSTSEEGLCEAPAADDDKTNKATDDTDDELPAPTSEDFDEDIEVPPSPEDVRDNMKQKFLVAMPDDFFDFWDCCVQLNKEKPEEALSTAGLTLVGPYDVLTGKLKGIKPRKISTYVCHWRYFYDPPEFMTVIAGDEKEYHIGYYRDDPHEMPGFAGSMSSVKRGVIKPLGENVFAAVCSHLREKVKEENPFKKTSLQKLYSEVESFAKKKNHSLEAETKGMKQRKKAVVAKTFHGAGIVVPLDEDDNGYREVPETNASLRKMFQKVIDAKTDKQRGQHFDDVQEIITNVQFANDEGDPGMGLEFGLDMFMFGHEEFHKPLYHVLSLAYEILGRKPYIDILQAHLKNRRRGTNLSILEIVE
ncbi:histone PARylation factor 1-like [Homarus americanus]|nr:histone PARylation factor 1-like [Homarus americanus]